VADEHVIALTVEASGEVTPAPQQPDAVEPTTEDEEPTDG
jgi:hypothetical protein